MEDDPDFGGKANGARPPSEEKKQFDFSVLESVGEPIVMATLYQAKYADLPKLK